MEMLFFFSTSRHLRKTAHSMRKYKGTRTSSSGSVVTCIYVYTGLAEATKLKGVEMHIQSGIRCSLNDQQRTVKAGEKS